MPAPTLTLPALRAPSLVRSVWISPRAIAGLILWLKSDAGAFQDTALTTPCTADGQNFRGWVDQSGTGTVVNGSTGAAPYAKYKTNVINGKPTMRGVATDGGTQFVLILSNLGMLANVAGATGFAVGQTAAGGAGTLLSLSGGTGTARFRLIQQAAVSAQLVTRRLDADGADTRAGGVPTAGRFYCTTGIADYANGARYVYQNGVLLNSTTGLAVGNTSNTSGTGTDNVGSNSVNYDLAEVILYNRALGAGERQAVEAYLRGRYAL